MSVYSTINNWHPIQFCYISHRQLNTKLDGVFEIYNQAAQLAIWPVCSLIFHRRDVKEASDKYNIKISKEQAVDPYFKCQRDGKTGLVAKTGLVFTDTAEKKSPGNHELRKKINNMKGVFKSSDGEVVWDTKKGLFKIDTPRSQGFVGFPVKKLIKFKDVKLKIKTDFAAVILSSLSNKSIKNSKKILLTAVSRTRNKGMKYHTRKGQIIDPGTAPVSLEAVEGDITFKSKSPVKVYSLDFSGKRKSLLKIKRVKGNYKFNLNSKNKSVYYEIVRD